MSVCPTCSGTGRISCGACWGGQTRPACPECLGRPRRGEVCPRCFGLGVVTPQSCPTCGNSSPCPDCGGERGKNA